MNYKIRKFLYEKDVLDIDVNSNELLKIHLSILKKKRLLNSAFKTFYKDMSKICDQFFSIDGLEIELGSGVGFFKDIRKNVLTSEFQRKGINYDNGQNIFSQSSNNNNKLFYTIRISSSAPWR